MQTCPEIRGSAKWQLGSLIHHQRHELLESPRGKRHGRVDSIVPRGERHARELCAVQVIVFLNIAKPHQDASVGLAHIYE
jgi:hypothetical protein